MAAHTIRTRTKPTGTKPETSVGAEATPGLSTMIIWVKDYKKYKKTKKAPEEDVSSRLFNLLLDHIHPDFRAKIEGRSMIPTVLPEQDCIQLMKEIHALHHLKDTS